MRRLWAVIPAAAAKCAWGTREGNVRSVCVCVRVRACVDVRGDARQDVAMQSEMGLHGSNGTAASS